MKKFLKKSDLTKHFHSADQTVTEWSLPIQVSLKSVLKDHFMPEVFFLDKLEDSGDQIFKEEDAESQYSL